MISITKLKDMLNYDPDTGLFTWAENVKEYNKTKFEGDPIGSKHKSGYIQIKLQGKVYQAHRLAWYYYHGVLPNGYIDHINHNKEDNRIANLRDVSAEDNAKNRTVSKSTTTGHQNIWYCKDRYKFIVQIRSKTHGRFERTYDTIEEAIEVRNQKLKEFGFHINHAMD